MPNQYPKPLPELTEEQIQRFWDNVLKGTPNECWPWTGSKDTYGYGQATFNGQRYRSHRIAYYLQTGINPESLQTLHRCDWPPCQNGSHLFLGTVKDNVKDAIQKGRMLIVAGHYPERQVRGERSPRSKLTDEDIREIRNERARYGTPDHQFAKRFGVTNCTIWHITHMRTWKHVK